MRFKDAEGTKLATFIQHCLYGWQSFQLFNRELVYGLDESEFADVRKTVLTVLAKAAIFPEYARVRQALKHTVSEASVAHIVEPWQHVHLL